MKYLLCRSLQLPCDVETAWQFFSSPLNLAKITPNTMNFKIISANQNEPIFEGMIINYTVSPLLKIPLKWKTKITEVDLNKSFTDFQQKGPYKYWKHTHEFIANSEGTLMTDRVIYELPYGIIGKLAHTILVKKKLEDIFDFREKKIEQLFKQS